MIRSTQKLIAATLLFLSYPSLGSALGEGITPEVSAAPEAGTPVQTLIRAFAKRTGKVILIDPKVDGKAQIVGKDAGTLTYGELLSVLQTLGLTAAESGTFLRVIPESVVRQSPLPLVSANATYPDAQYVSAVIPVRKLPAPTLVPILRPLLPQQAHLAAAICSNSLLIVDTFANVRRIESIIAALDVGEPYKADRCETKAATP